MIDRKHFIELIKRYLSERHLTTADDSMAEHYAEEWSKINGSEQKVYDILCKELQVTPQYDTSGNQKFNNNLINKPCDCGAKHTSFPNYHSDWCSAYRS